MIVSELINLLRKQDSDKAVGIQWGEEAELSAFVEDILLMTGTPDHVKNLGVGNRLGVIFLSMVDNGEFSIAVEDLLAALKDCNPGASVAVTSGIEVDEPEVGSVVGSNDSEEDVVVLTVQREEFIQRES